jgi:hypothetical protein
LLEEATSFGVAVVRNATESGLGLDFDIVHALDRLALPAARVLAGRAPACALVASLNVAEAESIGDDEFGSHPKVDAWLCDHPWAAELLRSPESGPARVAVVLSPETLSSLQIFDQPSHQETLDTQKYLFLQVNRRSRFSQGVLIEAVKLVREAIEGLKVAAFGVGPRVERLRGRLDRQELFAELADGSAVPGVGRWNQALSHAALVAVASRSIASDPTANLAWVSGRPVVSIATRDAEALGRAIREAIQRPAHRDHDVEVGRAISLRGLGPRSRAAAWMRVYLDASATRLYKPVLIDRDAQTAQSGAPLAFPELRSRLTLTALSAREVLASWSLRSDDRLAAMEWLGPEAVRAALTIRLFDVTDLMFDGKNAHSTWDVDVGAGETHRTIGLQFDRRSLAACLGLRTRWGYFHPIAHARICHLPREGLAPHLPTRQLRVMPRRG